MTNVIAKLAALVKISKKLTKIWNRLIDLDMIQLDFLGKTDAGAP